MKLKSFWVVALSTSTICTTLFSAVSKAEAFTFTSTASLSNQLTELTGSPILTLNKVDDALGRSLTVNEVLTQVQIQTSGTLRSSGTVTNTSANFQTFTFRVLGGLDLTPGGSAPTSITTPTTTIPDISTFNLTTIGTQVFTNLPANTSANFNNTGNPYSVTRSTNQIITAIAELSDFLGSGNFTFEPTTLISLSIFGGGGNINSSIETRIDANVIVTYTVETIPFEFSPVLGVSVLGGLYGLNQIRKKKLNSGK